MSVLSKEFASESICEKFTEALEQLMPGKSEVSENKADKLLKLIEWLNEYTKKLEAVLPENAGKFEELTEKLSDIIKDIQNMNNETSVAFDKEITEILRELIRTDNKNSKAVSEQKGEPVGENATEAYLEKNGDKNASANGKTDMEAQKETDTFIVKNNGKEKIKTHAEYNFKTASEDGSIEINKTNNSAKYFNNETQFEGDTLSDVFTHDASPKNMETEITVSGFRPETSRQTGLNPARIINQVINKAKVIIDGEKSEMVVNLKPDNLGKLSLKVITENGLVTAEITAENHQVKQMLEANMQQMKQSFEERGMFVESFTVSVRQDGRNNEGKRFFKQGSFKAGSISIDTSGKTSAYGGSFSDVSLIDPYFLEDSTINLTA
jgi:flagellar hook-length control protein FliK